MDDEEEDQPPRHPVYKFIKYSILCFCILATSYRIYLNYSTLCEYKMLINSKVELNEEETLPQLSVCFHDIIDEIKLDAVNDSLKEMFHDKVNDQNFEDWKIENFSLKTLFNLSFDYEDYFSNCTFLASDAIRELNCTDHYHITMSTTKKCFNFFYRPLNDSDQNWTYNRILLQNRPWVRIFVKKENLNHKKKMDIIINPYFSKPNTDKSNPGYKSYTTDYTQSIFVSYDCRKSERLPEPYETKCINYTDRGHFDRQHCIYECEVRNFLYRGGGWTKELTMNKTIAEKIEQLNITVNYTADLENDCETNDKCAKLDCISKEYTIINKYHKLDVNTNVSDIEVRLYLNSAPASSLEYEELYSLSNTFVSMFIGPASLWLGLSIFSLSKLAFWFLCEVTNRKSKQKDPKKLTENLDTNKFGLKSALKSRKGRPSNVSSLNKWNAFKVPSGDSTKLSNYLVDYNTKYAAFPSDNNLPKSVYLLGADFEKFKNRPNDKLANKLSENHFKEPNKNFAARYNTPSSFTQNYMRTVSGKLSPLTYKNGLEMYPKKPLKIKPDVWAAEKDARSKLSSWQATSEEILKKKSIENDNQKANNRMSKWAGQKNKLISHFFKRKRKVLPDSKNLHPAI